MDINKKKSFYTNGIKTIKLSDDEPVPDGFYKGRTFKVNPWNKGLTKETDERVAKYLENNSSLFKSGVKPWNAGLTKETDDRLKAISEKISESCKGRTAWNIGISMSEESKKKLSKSCLGRIAWNKGLTKEIDDRVKNISIHRKGQPCFVKDWGIAKKKEYETKRKNGTFNSSEPENKFYEELVKEYGSDDVIRPYHDERYPFNCDFYIKSLDLFIEYQGTWLHGNHPFDVENQDDLKILNNWKKLAKEKNSQFYASAVYVWSDLDVRKLKTARDNNLNFKFVYPNGYVVSE